MRLKKFVGTHEERLTYLLNTTQEMDFALLNKGGNEGFTKIMLGLIHIIDSEEGVGAKLDWVLGFLKKIPQLEKMKKYGDIRDTMVREIVLDHLEWVLRQYGLDVELSYYGLVSHS